MLTDEEILREYRKISGTNADAAELQDVLNTAKNKLSHIINRYGDADGARLTAKYAAMLVDEAVQTEAREIIYDGAGKSATMPVFLKKLTRAKAQIKKDRAQNASVNQKTQLNYNAFAANCQ